MATGNLWKTDLYSLHGYTQNSGIGYVIDTLIWALKEFFSQDHYYHYQNDSYGFSKISNNTNLPLDAGVNDSSQSRLYIGEYYRQDAQHFPAILVRNSGMRDSPVSMSRNKEFVRYMSIEYVDGYGNSAIVSRPQCFEQSGAWEGTFTIEVQSENSGSRNDLVDLIMLFFKDTAFEILVNQGIVVKNISAGGATDGDSRNDKLFKQTISLEIRTEWVRQIPIDNVVEIFKFCLEFGDTYKDPFTPAAGLTVEENIDLLDVLNNL